MIKRVQKSLMLGAMVVAVGSATVLGSNVSAYSIRDIFNREILDTRIDETIPLDVSDSQLSFMTSVANKFVDNLDVRDDHQAVELEIGGIEVDGIEEDLYDNLLKDEGDIYMSAADLSHQLALYLEREIEGGSLINPKNISKVVKATGKEIPAIRYENRVYISLRTLSEVLDTSIKIKGDTLEVNTEI